MISVLYSFFSRAGVTVINFLVVVITARQLGVEGRGIISLITLSLTFTLLVHQLVGGPALMYFARKVSLLRLIIPSYLWAIVAAIVVPLFFSMINQLPNQYVFHVVLISLLQSWLATNITLLQSYEKIKTQSFLNFIQSFMLLITLCLAFYFFGIKSIDVFVGALYVSIGATFGISIINIAQLKDDKTGNLLSFRKLMTGIFKYGFVIQSTNLAQLFNYRLSYFFINAFSGTHALGLFSTAMSVAESGWLFSRSLANVQFPKIVNSNDSSFKIKLTIQYASVGFFSAVFVMLGLLLIPETMYVLIFGKAFFGFKTIILLVAPGIVAMGYSTMHAHYLSGLSENNINLYASFIGFLITLFAGAVFIYFGNTVGAAITYSLSYISNSIFLLFIMRKKTGVNLIELLPSFKHLLRAGKKQL